MGKLCQKIFFGPLRAVEIEHLHERLWYAITESLLAMTIFRDDFDTSFALLFGTMLFLKVFHWLARDRVEYMEQSPSVTRMFHVRMVALLGLLFEFDIFLATFAVEVLLIDHNRKGIMIMFASEFFILTASLWSTIAKYLINCQDMRSEEPWEAKSMYVFFVDLATDFFKLVTYIACFGLILSFYGLPLNIIRDIYMTGRSFFGRLRDFVKYRAATRNMDTRFPDATRADLSSMSDGTCIICREEMVARGGELSQGIEPTSPVPPQTTASSSGLNETPKKLPCGHIFHFHCLRSWLERQQSCPTCRRTVFAPLGAATAAEGAAPPLAQGGEQPAVGAPREQLRDGTAIPQQDDQAANAAQAARARMQSLLQQLQSDAQRTRQDGQRVQPAQPQAAETRDARQAGPSEGVSTQSQARHALIQSLFGAYENGPVGRRAGDIGSAQSASTEHALPSATKDSSRERSQEENILIKHIPPAPWTFDGAGTCQPRRESSAAGKRVRIAEDEHVGGGKASQRQQAGGPDAASEVQQASTSANDTSSKEIDAPVDPSDAREAARAAALRRFEKMKRSNGDASAQTTSAGPSDLASILMSAGEGAQSGGPQATAAAASKPDKAPLPSDPRLIPLFDPSNVEDFDAHHAPRLPFPVLDRGRNNDMQAPRRRNGTPLLETPLPSTLPLSISTDEMTRLSRQTRQGLEERLRLLYRVENTVTGLVEELTRALSAIPSDDAVDDEQSGVTETATATATAMAVDGSDHVQSGSSALPAAAASKGKAPAEGVHASDLRPPPSSATPPSSAGDTHAEQTREAGVPFLSDP